MEIEELPLEAPDKVLSTLNPDGTRRWLTPRLAKGRFWKARRLLAYFLIGIFTALPWISIGGKPAILLDLGQRQFTLLGVTFQPTETLLVTVLLLGVFFSIFLATALFGRVWCGWGCPQTVYLEFLYRPLERLIEGRYYRRGAGAVPIWRKLLKLLVFALVSVHLAHTFLAYFAGGSAVLEWSLHNPAEHMTGFAIVWLMAGLILFDFGIFREQMCTLACPYGRLQSVLLDPDSIVIGYDKQRGEPRGLGKRGTEKTRDLGACVDCKLCVAVCPTGIDIRDGLQMECVNCAECIDACDEVMDRTGQARGLIRYASERQFEGQPRKLLRPRTLVYSLVFVGIMATFGGLLSGRQDTAVSVLRLHSVPFFQLEDGRISNLVKLSIENRSEDERTYVVRVDEARVQTSPERVSVVVPGLGDGEVNFNAVAERSLFERGKLKVTLVVSHGSDSKLTVEKTLLGPRR